MSNTSEKGLYVEEKKNEQWKQEGWIKWLYLSEQF